MFEKKNKANELDTMKERVNLEDAMAKLALSNIEVNDRQKELYDTVQDITLKLNGVSKSVTDINKRMFNLEQNEEITTEQDKNIRSIAARRVYELEEERGISEEERNLYFGPIVKKLYGDARRYTGLASSIARTHKRDYDRIIEYIDAWNPTVDFEDIIAKKNKQLELKAEKEREKLIAAISSLNLRR